MILRRSEASTASSRRAVRLATFVALTLLVLVANVPGAVALSSTNLLSARSNGDTTP